MKQAREHVKAGNRFRGSNVFGRNLHNGSYCVWSYTEAWPLYLRWCGEWFGNSGWYSRTTHQHKVILCPGDKISWLPRSVMQVFVAYCDSASWHSKDTPLDYVLETSGLIPPRAVVAVPQPNIPEVTTHLARAEVDWGAVRRRRVMPV